MTSDMAFECLLVSRDPAVLCTVDSILQDFSISTRICPDPSRVANLLGEGGTDLVVIDLEADSSSALLKQIRDLKFTRSLQLLQLRPRIRLSRVSTSSFANL